MSEEPSVKRRLAAILAADIAGYSTASRPSLRRARWASETVLASLLASSATLFRQHALNVSDSHRATNPPTARLNVRDITR